MDLIQARGFASPLATLAKMPILRTRLRKAFDLKFPQLTLNAGNTDSAVVRTPGNAHFLARQIFYSVAATSQPANLGVARITPASQLRPNMQWMNELVPLELFAAASPMTPHVFYRPILIEPNTTLTLELQNTDSSQHLYDVTLAGELIFDLSAQEIDEYMAYSWFGFYRQITPDHAALPSSSVELRNLPDADFYITHLSSMSCAPSNSATEGPIRTRIRASSQGRELMDQCVANTLLMGAYYNVTLTPKTSLGPQPLPEPMKIDRNASIIVQAIQPDKAAPAAFGLFLEGVRVFR